MKRLHMHVAVADLSASIRFYSTLFAAEPTLRKEDYAKWMLEDPRLNFAISSRDRRPGVDHVGIQVETREELDQVQGRLRRAGRPMIEEGQTTCCYARSEKAWITDPSGLSWETFLTTGESIAYGNGVDLGAIRTTSETASSEAACSAARISHESCCERA